MGDDQQARLTDGLFQRLDWLHAELRRNSGYLARQEIERLVDGLRANPHRLEQYGYKVYSQNDEDGILAEIFRRIDLSAGVFCEIGVENGLECNTLWLLHRGWRGGWLEANEVQRPAIEQKFQSLLTTKRLALAIGRLAPGNVNGALRQVLSSLDLGLDELDFLSIDVDGMDIYLLEALECAPKVICIEYNAKFPPPVSKVPVYQEDYVWRFGDYMGSSLTAVNEAAVAKGYSLVATNLTGVNAFFVRNDLVKDRFEKDLTPENLYNPPRYYLTYDHYSGSVGHRADFGPYTDIA